MTSKALTTRSILAASLLATLALAGCTDDGSTDNSTTQGGGEDSNPDYGQQETWYLHETGPCGNEAPQEYFLSKADDVDDAHGCGTVGYDLTGGGFTFTFPSTEPSHGHDTAIPMEVSIYLQVSPPGATTVEWSLNGGGTIASGTIEQDTTGNTGYVEFADQATTLRAIEPGTNLTFEYTVVASGGGVTRGYPDDTPPTILLG